ncbi:MAG: aspartate/glutamate racemase family protein [Pseudomonadota bacterium]
MTSERRQIAVLGTGDAPDGLPAVPDPIVQAAQHSQPEIMEVPGAVFPLDTSSRKICEGAYVTAAGSAATQGYAGAYINTVGDYGLAALRQSGPITVTGAGEGSIRTALSTHQRFAIVTIWPPQMRFIYDAVLGFCDADNQCVGIHHLSDDEALATLAEPDNFVQQMRGCALTSISQIENACRAALTREGAEVIILGCTCMAPTAAMLEDRGIPLIEPMAAGYRYLEQLLRGA